MPLRRGQIRPSALAGRWYPGDPAALDDAVGRYANAPYDGPIADTRAIIAPHAGYMYSGAIAGRAFAALSGPYTRAIVIGPAHRVAFHGISAADFEAYAIPGRPVRVDRPAVAGLLAAGLVTFVPHAHQDEHCLEIMLPFIRRTLGDVPIVPLLVGSTDHAAVVRALDACLRADDLLVVSTDLSHFNPYEVARQRDLETLERLVNGHVMDLTGRDACGYQGARAAVTLAATRGWDRHLVAYANSGDSAGDRSSVVGYGAVAMGLQ